MDANVAQEDKELAMKMIIHLLGDIHNPVHIGFREDTGGNDIPISGIVNARFPPNLHNIWDFHLLVRFNRKMFVQNIHPPQQDTIMDTLASKDEVTYKDIRDAMIDIATETSRLVCDAYRHVEGNRRWIEPNDPLEAQYMNQMSLVAQGQIRKAGIRLAKIIDIMASKTLGTTLKSASSQLTGADTHLDHGSRKHTKSAESFCMHTTFFFVLYFFVIMHN